MQALVAQVLAAWREAERIVSQQSPGPAREAAAAAGARLHEVYEALVEHERRSDGSSRTAKPLVASSTALPRFPETEMS